MVLLTIAVVAGVSAVVAGVVTGGLEEPASPIPPRALPTGPLTGQDVADLRFVQGFRGYRMDQVDAAMDGLAVELDRLRGLLAKAEIDPDAASVVLPGAAVDPGTAAIAKTNLVKDVKGTAATADEKDTSDNLPAGWPAGRD